MSQLPWTPGGDLFRDKHPPFLYLGILLLLLPSFIHYLLTYLFAFIYPYILTFGGFMS